MSLNKVIASVSRAADVSRHGLNWGRLIFKSGSKLSPSFTVRLRFYRTIDSLAPT